MTRLADSMKELQQRALTARAKYWAHVMRPDLPPEQQSSWTTEDIKLAREAAAAEREYMAALMEHA